MTDGLNSESQVEYAETETVVELQDRAKRQLEDDQYDEALGTLVDLRFIVDTGRAPASMTTEERERIRGELSEEYDDLEALQEAIERLDPHGIA